MSTCHLSLKLIHYYSHEKSDFFRWEFLVSAVWEDPAENPVVVTGYLCKVVFMEALWSSGKDEVPFGALAVVLGKPWEPHIHYAFGGIAL